MNQLDIYKMPEVGFAVDFNANELEIVRALGSGGFGTVYQATYRGETVALKKLHTNTKNKKAAMQSFRSETREEVVNFCHPHIAKTLYYSIASSIEDLPFLVIEFIENKTLQHLLDDPVEVIDDARRMKFALEITSALEYVHRQNVAHLDLKPVNILLTNEDSCKLGDFGCSEIVEDRPVSPTRSYLTGTFAYRAPELLRGQSASCKADIYSFGICLWQLWTRDTPYRGKNQHVVIFGVVSKHLRPKLSDDNMPDNKYRELMTTCWSACPDKRPSSKELLDVLQCWKD